jgi:hypothetical protein
MGLRRKLAFRSISRRLIRGPLKSARRKYSRPRLISSIDLNAFIDCEENGLY